MSARNVALAVPRGCGVFGGPGSESESLLRVECVREPVRLSAGDSALVLSELVGITAEGW